MLIHETKDARYWTGVSKEITEKEGIPPLWFAGELPELVDGEYAIWVGRGWSKTTTPPKGPQKYPDTETARAAMLGWINDLTAKITDAYPAAEVASWPSKAEAARAVVAGTARQDQTDMIQAEADLTGASLADQAAAIVAKAQVFEAIVSKTSGLRQATDAALVAATTSAEREAALDAAMTAAAAMAAEYGLA